MNKRLAGILMMAAALAFSLSAQRKVTPVDIDDHKPQAPVLHYYDKHGNPLNEPVLFLSELDTVANTPERAKPIYPRLTSVSVGLNFFDGIMAIAGQKYGGADIRADLSLYNWIFPTIEFGLGYARTHPDGGNFTYTGKPAFYAKVGADYNFLYKSSDDYRLFAGVRCGFSDFRYDITDITINSPYWQETSHFSISGQHSTAVYGEVLAGLRVRIYKALSLGWSVRYKFMMHCTDGVESTPYYIPGYGSRNSHLGATFSVFYTIPFHKPHTTD